MIIYYNGVNINSNLQLLQGYKMEESIMIATAELRETTNNDSTAVIKLGHTISAPNLIKDMQDYCNKGTRKDIILKRLTDNYNAL